MASVNQMGKTHSKSLAARHGRGTAWARDGHCLLCVNRPLTEDWRQFRDAELHNVLSAVTVRLITVTSGACSERGRDCDRPAVLVEFS